MTRLFAPRWARVALVLGIGLIAAASASAQAPAPAPPAPSLQGLFRSGETTLRVTVNKTEARAVFADVGQGARNLGFKPAEVSFVGTVMGNMIHGEQTIRYGAKCHPNGRKVAMMARLTPNGQALAIHNYMLQIDANCRDTGQYNVEQTVWQRVAER